jgi:hypothetical protein
MPDAFISALEKIAQYFHGLFWRYNTHVVHDAQRAESTETSLTGSHAQACPMLDIAYIAR